MLKNKLFVILVVFLFEIILISILVQVRAQELSDTGLPPEVEKIENISEKGKEAYEKLTEKNESYLKQEWGKILAKNKYFGPLIEKYDKISPYTDPIFKYTIGLEPSLSWLFVLTLVLWIFILIYIIRILEFSSFSAGVRYGIALIFMIIASTIGIPKKIAELIINLIIKLATTWWIQLIAIGVVIAAFVLAIVFSENLKQWVKKIRENRAKMKEALNRAKLEASVKVAEEFTEGLTEK